MASHHLTSSIHDSTLFRPNPLGEPTAGVPVGNEANVVAVRLLCHKEPSLSCFRADLILGGSGAQRKITVLELFGGEHTQNVGLVFGPGGGAVQFFATFALDHGGVVTGRDGVKSQCQPSLHHRIKLDVLVTAHAGVRGATLSVLIHKILNNIGRKALGEIPDVEGDAQHVGYAPRIH